MKIDSHQHFWKYEKAGYPWMSDQMKVLRKDFLPEDLKPLLDKHSIEGTVAVQARQEEKENDFLLSLAGANPWIKGVVGWVDLRDPKVAERLEYFSANKLLKGVRHVVHDEPDPNFLLARPFNQGVSYLKDYGLSYDILVFEKHLEVATEFTDRHPYTRLVLDHIAKPRISEGIIEPWETWIREISQRENLYCKVSGMVTEANWKSWTAKEIEPYFEIILEAFGPDRLMMGSDWPVSTLAGSYGKTYSLLEGFISQLSEDEQTGILGGNAARFYKL